MTDSHQRPARVLLVQLDEAGYAALAAGDAEATADAVPVPVTAYALGPAWRATWQRRLAQVRQHPAAAWWLTALLWDPEEGRELVYEREAR